MIPASVFPAFTPAKICRILNKSIVFFLVSRQAERKDQAVDCLGGLKVNCQSPHSEMAVSAAWRFEPRMRLAGRGADVTASRRAE